MRGGGACCECHYRIFPTCAVTLTPSTNIGFLIQARDTGMLDDSSIWGKWMNDPENTPTYQIIQCGMNDENTEVTRNVSTVILHVTHHSIPCQHVTYPVSM